MTRLLSFIAAVAVSATLAHAETLSDSDKSAFRSIITNQIEAFRADDGARAYSYAAPIIKHIFPTPDQFMAMVRDGYKPVYHPDSFQFGDAGFAASGRPIQRVKLVGQDGLDYEAIYTMEQQPDGTWQISGCAIVRVPELGA